MKRFRGGCDFVHSAALVTSVVVVLAGADLLLAEVDPVQHRLVTTNAPSDDRYGQTTAVSFPYAIVSAHYSGDKGYRAGAAYIFFFNGSNWSQQAKLTAADGVSGDNFGVDVDIDGDYALAGAWGSDPWGSYSGAAYVFVRQDTNWVQQAKLIAADGDSFDWFGLEVALSSNTALISAKADEEYGNYSGSAYIFVRQGSNWIQQAKLYADDAAEDDRFGTDVDIAGDQAIIGAQYDDDVAEDAGAAYVFQRQGTNWIQEAKLYAADGTSSARFGYAVGIDQQHAVVGVYRHDATPTSGLFSGAAYVFGEDPGSGWVQEDMLLPTNLWQDVAFGRAVAIWGPRVFVGCPQSHDGGVRSGVAYVFEKDGDTWQRWISFVPDDTVANQEFGTSVKIDESFAAGSSVGSPYVFELPTSPQLELVSWQSNSLSFSVTQLSPSYTCVIDRCTSLSTGQWEEVDAFSCEGTTSNWSTPAIDHQQGVFYRAGKRE